MISRTTFFLQVLGAAFLALFIVWSTYRSDKYARPNNRWEMP
jgi:hypothetical protein